ncbi:MAG TPA: carboxypeptidase-like regulatory domain-containing protein, partial [Hanamia sp.]|nr:carboxypeptidase-like regulatory domain-containing protein [Hanamia sp.]
MSKQCIRILFAAFFFCFVTSENVFAKKYSNDKIYNTAIIVKGTIRDGSNGKPLEGATIAVKGSSESTISDVQGNFSISVPGNNSVLVISYVGYVTREIPVGDKTNINIELQPTSAELNQVVVVGYGTQNKKDITGAVKSLKSESFNKGIITSPQQLLQGKVSGVNVTSASGEPG